MEDVVEGVFFLEEGGEVGAELRGKGGGERGGDLEARWGGGRGVVCYHFGGGSWEVGACGSLSWEEGLGRWCVGFTEVIVSEGLSGGDFRYGCVRRDFLAGVIPRSLFGWSLEMYHFRAFYRSCGNPASLCQLDEVTEVLLIP